MKPHRFVPKSGHRWRWCAICGLTDTADVHRNPTPPEPDTEESGEA